MTPEEAAVIAAGDKLQWDSANIYERDHVSIPLGMWNEFDDARRKLRESRKPKPRYALSGPDIVDRLGWISPVRVSCVANAYQSNLEKLRNAVCDAMNAAQEER